MEATDGDRRRRTGARLPGLDGLRAVSILLVIGAHAQMTTTTPAGLAPWLPFIGNSFVGVNTFFVISGFLITRLLRREHEATGRISLRAFYLRRVTRIFPAFYAYLGGLALLTAAIGIAIPAPDYAFAAGFLKNYQGLCDAGSDASYWFTGHFWTLSLEEQFYLLWPATVVLLGLRRAPFIAIGIVAASPFIRIASYLLWPSSRPLLNMMLHTAGDALMIGCAAALLHDHPRVAAWRRRMSSARWPALFAAWGLVASPLLQGAVGGAYRATVGPALDGLAALFVMLWLMEHPRSAAGRALDWPAVRYVGVLSYSLYLWQQFFLTTLNPLSAARFPFNLAATFVAAMLSYHLVEQPVLRWRARGVTPAPRQPRQSNGRVGRTAPQWRACRA